MNTLSLATGSVAVLLLVAAPARAQTQAQINVAAAADYRRADAALNVIYAERMVDAKSARGEGTALLESQRAWLRFRDTECQRRAFRSRGGTIHALEVTTCLAALTRQRVAQLRPPQR